MYDKSNRLSTLTYLTNLFRSHCEQVRRTLLNVFYYLASQFVALVILIQKTHCTNAEKLVLPGFQLDGSSLLSKHGLAQFHI